MPIQAPQQINLARMTIRFSRDDGNGHAWCPLGLAVAER